MANANRSPYQPVSAGVGLLSFVQRLFVATPAYRGDGQPRPGGGGILGGFFSGTPVYQTSPPLKPSEAAQGESFDPKSDAGDVPDCDSGPLTIVIARD